MLISEALNNAINTQIGHELGNSNQYLAIAAYFESESLFGLAKIHFTQSEEERDHAMKLIKFVLEAGGKVVVPAVPAPRAEFHSAEEAAKVAYDTEVQTTEQIYGLMAQATKEQNFIAMNALQWFVSEQLEEVATAQSRLDVIRRAGPSVLMVEAYLVHNGKA